MSALFVCCDYNGHVRFTMTHKWGLARYVDEHRGEVQYEIVGCDIDGRVGIYNQIKGPAKTGPMRCADGPLGGYTS